MRLHILQIAAGLAGLSLLLLAFLAAGVAAAAWLAAAALVAGAGWLVLSLARRRLSRPRNTA
jgi:hypothetical protein